MSIHKAKVKMDNGYGNITLPKNLLQKRGWEKGDLIQFKVYDSELIDMEKVLPNSKVQDYAGKYDKTYCKRICRTGGTSSLGIKGISQPILESLEVKHNTVLYFISIDDTSLFYPMFGDEKLKPPNSIFASLSKESLISLEPLNDDLFDIEDYFKKWAKKEYKLPFFTGRSSLSNKNNQKAWNTVIRKNRKYVKDRIEVIDAEIARKKSDLTYVENSYHPYRKELIQQLNDRIRTLKIERHSLETQGSKIFGDPKKPVKTKIKTKKQINQKSSQKIRQNVSPSAWGYFFSMNNRLPCFF